MSKNKNQGKNNKMKPWAKVLISFAVVILLLVGAAFIYVKNKLDKIDYSNGKSVIAKEESTASGGELEAVEVEDDYSIDISKLEIQEDVQPPVGEVWGEDHIINILLLGTDERTADFSEDARADCIMLVSLDLDNHKIKLASLERGMGVVMFGGVHEGKVDLLTHCFRWGGAELMMTEVQEYFKVKVDRYVRVNFTALKSAINALGGVEVELTKDEAWWINEHIGKSEKEQQYLVEGKNRLFGAAALSYARLRGLDSDWQRIERQRNLLQQCLNEVKDANLLTLNSLANEILPMIQTNFTEKEILQIMLQAPQFLGTTCDQITIPVDRDTMGGVARFSGGGAFAPDYELNAAALQEFIYGENHLDDEEE